ncbi:zinc-binding dehydrogenase [Mesorhizobium sp. M7D.F.Ca.US.004.01.2.1]|uniref:zinc-dependent alcohol dehydrogenase n=2 Tax=unclassified Mesorhizobium TaxID=325217 RepID=UPI000FCB334D|nr:zinc-binding dehydrogenase [Mesorhizobium sp. M7D.F.Ca.US.004.01.2.1]RUX90776.1 hypothetical protein EN993_29400 [Mesorhizobium sp. M7D.F.Ca.US.004.01.2.1]
MEKMIFGVALSKKRVAPICRPVKGLPSGWVRLDLRRAAFCGCGRETVVYKGFRQPARAGVIAGHQMMGTVRESTVACLAAGQRVAVYPYVGCGHCEVCIARNASLCEVSLTKLGTDVDGGWATGIVVPGNVCVPLSDNTPDDLAALAGCSLSTAYSGLRRVGLKRGDHLLAYNAGSLGLSAIAIAAELGARVTVVEPNFVRQRVAKELGAQDILDEHDPDLEAKIAAVGTTQAFDVAFDPTNDEASRRRCLNALRHGGRLVMAGEWNGPTITDTHTIIAKQLTLIGSWAFSQDEQLAVLRMLEGPFRDRAARLITHTFPLPQAEDGFTLYDSLTTGIIAIDCTQADGLR